MQFTVLQVVMIVIGYGLLVGAESWCLGYFVGLVAQIIGSCIGVLGGTFFGLWLGSRIIL